MILGIYAIRDKKTGFLSPTVDQNDAAARRNFEHAMMNEQSLMFSHAEDYALYRVGSYDTDTGVIAFCEHVLILDGNGYGMSIGGDSNA